MMLPSLPRPWYFGRAPGYNTHLIKHAGVARSVGMDPKKIIISDIGRVIETDGVTMRLAGTVPSGRVLVDGLGVGDVGSVVLRDLISRGFVYVRENEEMMDGARNAVLKALSQCRLTGYRDWSSIKGKIRDDLSDYIYARTRRRPMILPVIEEVG